MKIIINILVILLILFLIMFSYCACVISSRCSKNEELEEKFDNK